MPSWREMAKSGAARVAALRERRQAAGQKRLQVYLSAEDHRLVSRVARICEVSMEEWARSVLVAAARKKSTRRPTK